MDNSRDLRIVSWLFAASLTVNANADTTFTFDISGWKFTNLAFSFAQSGNGLIWTLDINNSNKSVLTFVVHNTTNNNFAGTTYPFVVGFGYS